MSDAHEYDPLDFIRRDAMRSAAEDHQAMAARRDVCNELVLGLKATSTTLRFFGGVFGKDRVNGRSPFGFGTDGMVAIGYLSETAAMLISGAVSLIEDQNVYASSALNRQLVEVEYLSWAFSEDLEEAANWLRSTREERLRRWQPKHLRDRANGRFRGTDYFEHCETGGHPTPLGLRSLLSSTKRQMAIGITLRETVHHGASTWEYMKSAIARAGTDMGVDWEPLISIEHDDAIAKSMAEWNAVDRVGPLWGAIQEQVDG
jgi:hypothetical protein